MSEKIHFSLNLASFKMDPCQMSQKNIGYIFLTKFYLFIN